MGKENNYTEALEQLFDSANVLISDISPSQWVEKNRTMSSAESPFPGPFRYDNSPYCREIVDCMMPDHPARIISVMKGAQVGFSTGVIEPGIGWTIAENPCNILFLTGHTELSEEAIAKIDGMINSCGIRHLIRPTVVRSRNSKTGDTNTKKEFVGGSLVSGGASNHRLLRQRSVKVIFIDDFDAAKGSTKESGSTRKMIQQRAAAYYDESKIFYISTPELRPSNIEKVFLEGDQRYYHIPCPCCGEFIALHWEIPMEDDSGEMAGMIWQQDPAGKLVKGSVAYKCQKCAGIFPDNNKHELLKLGQWIPTAEPLQEGNYSYHLSALYAPPGMYDWEYYVREYITANPPDGNRKEEDHQTFINLCLGLPYEFTAEDVKATELQKNCRAYEIGMIPEKLSEADGNGKIVLLTLGCDLNGKLDDARLDYEIVGYSESGATYSISHGSIGTFIPREGQKGIDRAKWTYEHSKERSVWPELDKILANLYETDTGRKMQIYIAGVDTGYQKEYAYDYIDRSNFNVIGLKGKDADKYIPIGRDSKTFKQSLEKHNLFLVESNVTKDVLAGYMRLKWDKQMNEIQPNGFMNFPMSASGLYQFENYFSHFEAEKRIPKDGKFKWQKKNDMVQNHLFDCRLYANVCRDIFLHTVMKELGIKNGTWEDYCNILLGRKKVINGQLI